MNAMRLMPLKASGSCLNLSRPPRYMNSSLPANSTLSGVNTFVSNLSDAVTCRRELLARLMLADLRARELCTGLRRTRPLSEVCGSASTGLGADMRPWKLDMSRGCVIVACIFDVTSASLHLAKLERHRNPQGSSMVRIELEGQRAHRQSKRGIQGCHETPRRRHCGSHRPSSPVMSLVICPDRQQRVRAAF